MEDKVLIGKAREINAIPVEEWKGHFAGIDGIMAERLSFTTPDHHLLRYAAVRELPGNKGLPLSPHTLAEVTGLCLPRVQTLLGELEKKLFFLVRNDDGHVNWAFPVTTDRTPHRLSFSTGERLFGA